MAPSPAAAWPSPAPRPKATRRLLALAIAAPLQDVAPTPQEPPERPAADRSGGLEHPAIVHDEGYVGSDTCQACHPRNHETWHASYHRTMTQAATPAAVLAPFEGSTPALEGRAWALEQDGERFFATPSRAPAIPGSGGERAPPGPRREVVLTTGSHHYQIYWLAALPGLGMEQLPLVWHRAEERWVPRKSMFLAPPAPESGDETGRWEATCIKCHATNGTRDHSAGGTRVAELGIACEACHGPGRTHASWHRDPAHEDLDVPREAELVHPARLPKERSAEICGQCHAIRPLVEGQRRAWASEGFSFRPGQDLEASRPLLRGRREENGPALRELLRARDVRLEEYFWPDGEVRVSGREFNGLVESPCYQRGTLTCLSCHEMHPAEGDPRRLSAWADDQLQAGKEGPDACLGCHAPLAEPAQLAEHTHHPPGSAGSACLDCHMPYTTYGLTKAIRSHRISSPSVAAELATGRPGACNLCHLDRTLAWTAERLETWYGHGRPALDEEHATVAASILYALRGDAGQRALLAWALGWPPARAVSGTGWMPFVLSTLLMDPYDAVRWIAVQSVRLDPRYGAFELDFTRWIEDQRNHVRETVLSDWLEHGLEAAPERRDALLIRPDGSLDEERFRRIFARRDDREVRLNE